MRQEQLNEGFPARTVYTNSREEDIVHLRLEYSFIELTRALVAAAERELLQKALIVEAKVDDFTACERLAYQILRSTF